MELILETFILALMVNGTQSHRDNQRILINIIIAQIIMILMLKNIKVNVEHH